MYRIGIDLGSSYTKGVLVDEGNQIVDSLCVKTGYSFINAAKTIIGKFSKDHQIQFPVYSCGYGREQPGVPYVAKSEITALSKAVYDIYKKPCSVIDIGGQDTKYIKINGKGQVDKFKMNRKCAAGTGSFLEEIAFRLDISALEFNQIAEQSTKEIRINSFCTVFAISEIIGMIKNGADMPGIVLGIYNSIIERSFELALIEDFLVVTGGIPDNHPMILKLFKNKFENTESPERSQFLAAYGCVLLNNTILET
jgi:predicted CoA-substrate-specific enzyme activase